MLAYVLICPLFSLVGVVYAITQGHSIWGILAAYLAFSVVGCIVAAGAIYQRSVSSEKQGIATE